MLIVLWSLVLFSLLVTAITAAGGGRARQASAFVRNAQLGACAAGGVEQAVFHLLDQGAGHVPADGQTRALRGDGCTLRVAVTSQDGKINPNIASAALLTGLLQAAGTDARAAPRIAAAMVAWRFPAAPQPSVSGLDYRPPGSPFESLNEIGLVPGMTPALLRTIAPVLTLYREGDPNLLDATPLVRRAVALSTGTDPDPDDGQAQSSVATGTDRFDASVVEVAVEAVDGHGHVARRRVIVLTGNGVGHDSPAASPFRIVDWEPF